MLKSLLSLLLSLFYSKSESAEVASQSLPNETDFTSVTLNTSQPDTFAAPYDGYLCIVVDTGGSINVWGDGLQSSNYSLNNGQSKLFVPMRKGNIIGYSISGRLIFGKFYKLVGGGYNTIEKLIRRGGAICLSNLYNSLRRSSSSTRKAKSLLLLPQRLILTRNTQQFNGPNEWSDVITAPFDGWIRVEGECSAPVYLDVSPYSNALRQGVYRPSGFISCVCRISKGAKINYVFSTGGTVSKRRVLLIPCNGSST